MKMDVSHVAKLANLTLDSKEIKKFESQLSSVLDYIKKLEEVDTKEVSPTSQITGLEDVFRKDVAASSLSQVEVLSNAKAQRDSMFQVKGVFGVDS